MDKDSLPNGISACGVIFDTIIRCPTSLATDLLSALVESVSQMAFALALLVEIRYNDLLPNVITY